MPYYYEIREVRSNNGFGCLLVVALIILVFAYFSAASSDGSYDSYGTMPAQENGDLGITGFPISNVGL